MSALASLARAYDALQEQDKAVEFYELALQIARELGDNRAERDALKHLNAFLNPQIPRETKAKAGTQKTNQSHQSRAKKRPRKKSSAKAAKKAAKKTSPRKFLAVHGGPDTERTELDE